MGDCLNCGKQNLPDEYHYYESVGVCKVHSRINFKFLRYERKT